MSAAMHASTEIGGFPMPDASSASTGAAFEADALEMPVDIGSPADAPANPVELKKIRYRAKPKFTFPIHAKAVLADPSTYEAIRPEDFGLTREVSIGHRLTGWNAVRGRAQKLGLDLTDAVIQEVTRVIKERADSAPMSMPDIDALLMAREGVR